MKNGISLIVPAYNEEDILQGNITKLYKFLQEKKIIFEILIVSNGSKDETSEIGQNLDKGFSEIRFFHIREKGVGLSFKKGFEESKYEKIISIDVDLPVDLNFIIEAFDLLDDYNLVIGSKISGVQRRSPLRRVMSKIFIFLVSIFLDIHFSDYSPDSKGYRKNKFQNKISEIDWGTFFVVKFLYRAFKENLKIVEVPIACHDMRKTKFSLIGESFYKIKSLLKFWWQERIKNKN